jgi:hypothetical protein
VIEFDLRIPVANWLLSRGLVPVCEMYSLNNCDLVGFAFNERKKLCRMVAVELKLSNVAEVIRQCRSHRWHANEVWAAMPTVSAKQQKKFRDLGIGLLCVEGEQVAVVCEPELFERTLDELKPWQNVARRRRDEYKWRMQNHRMLRFAKHELAEVA